MLSCFETSFKTTSHQEEWISLKLHVSSVFTIVCLNFRYNWEENTVTELNFLSQLRFFFLSLTFLVVFLLLFRASRWFIQGFPVIYSGISFWSLKTSYFNAQTPLLSTIDRNARCNLLLMKLIFQGLTTVNIKLRLFARNNLHSRGRLRFS